MIRNFAVALGATFALAVSPLAAQDTVLHLHTMQDTFHVTGGIQGQTVLACLGSQQIQYTLPGNASLLVSPTVVFTLGQFDAAGAYSKSLSVPSGAPFDSLIQAVSFDPPVQQFQTSELRAVRYDGTHFMFDQH